MDPQEGAGQVSRVSNAVTRGIRVEVVHRYIPERSNPLESQYLFAYQVTITNEGDRPVQLLNRHWFIKDAFKRIEEVKGPGVVGHQPRLEPGESFRYTSFCPLPTPQGDMRGTYEMIYEDGSTFDAEIAPFVLMVPGLLN